MQEIVGGIDLVPGQIALVASRFNESIVEKLIEGAKNAFTRYGMDSDQLTLIRVPGAYEIPFAVQMAAQTGQYAGIMALGAVIRGQTSHFDYVAGCCASGLMEVQLKTNVPMSFCVLTTENFEQAEERASLDKGNKGDEYALSLLEMIHLAEKIRG